MRFLRGVQLYRLMLKVFFVKLFSPKWKAQALIRKFLIKVMQLGCDFSISGSGLHDLNPIFEASLVI